MMDPKLTEAWMSLLTQAMQGATETRAALRSLAERVPKREDLGRLLAQFSPPGLETPKLDQLEGWLEDVWSAMGVVPRHRYREVLERCEQLAARLREAEATIGRLRILLGAQGEQTEVKAVLDSWQGAVAQALRAHAEWMRALAVPEPSESEGD